MKVEFIYDMDKFNRFRMVIFNNSRAYGLTP